MLVGVYARARARAISQHNECVRWRASNLAHAQTSGKARRARMRRPQWAPTRARVSARVTNVRARARNEARVRVPAVMLACDARVRERAQ